VFDYQDVYHVGVRVRDLEVAMRDLGVSLGLTWAEVTHRQQRVWLPGEGATTIQLDFTYSCEGPQHVELLKGSAGSIWDASDWPGVHHMGVWVGDVAATTEQLVATGWTLEIAQLPPEDGYGAFTYVRAPSGFLLEPVSSALKPFFEQWWAGGSLG
jgi:catechol 2,3-dioxygenase-like lactoylglutathione lyase family enzyme